MFRVHHRLRHCVGPLNYLNAWLNLQKNLSRNPNENLIQKLHPSKVDLATYNFRVQKPIDVWFSRVMFSLKCIQMHGVGNFHYFSLWQDLSNGVSSDPNEDWMQKLHNWEFMYQLTTSRFTKVLAIHVQG